MTAVRSAIEDRFQEYGASVLAGDVDRWIRLWVDDGVQLPPDHPMNKGRAQIYAWGKSNFEALRYSSFDVTVDDVHVGGDTAVAHGTYTFLAELIDTGEPIAMDGKFLTVFQEQDDGTWKVYRDAFNSNVPLI